MEHNWEQMLQMIIMVMGKLKFSYKRKGEAEESDETTK